MKVRAGNFVKRQTPESRFAHFEGTWEELEKLVDKAHSLGYFKKGYREGVILVQLSPCMHPKKFKSSIVDLDRSVCDLKALFEARVEGEDKVLSVVAFREKVPAKTVDIVLYHHDVLAEDDDATFTKEEAEWEIVSINAAPNEEEVPMNPVAMARNFLHKKGGTKGEYSAQQFAEAIWYWSRHAMVQEE